MPKSWERINKGYDPKVLELAKWFLEGTPASFDTEATREELARTIQDTVEDFIWLKRGDDGK